MQIYISYARKDQKYEERLKTVLLPTQSFGYTVWSQRDIVPGTKWQTEMGNHLASSWFFMPLVSSDWLANDLCQVELKGAMQLVKMSGSKLWIIPILIRTCLWEYSEIKEFTHLPENGKVISNWKSQDEAWASIQKSILKMVQSRMIQ